MLLVPTKLKRSNLGMNSAEVLGEAVEMISHTAETTLKVKDEITEAEEIVTALRQQCEVQVTTTSVGLRKGPAGTQIALVQLPVCQLTVSTAITHFVLELLGEVDLENG